MASRSGRTTWAVPGASQEAIDDAVDEHEAAGNPHPGYLTPAEGDAAYWPLSTDLATQAELNAEAALARNGDNITTGTVADARIAATIARDAEVTAAVAAHVDDAAAAHAASAISYGGASGISATDVEAAIDELAAEKADLAVAKTEAIVVAISDETTTVTAAAPAFTMRMPYAFTLTGVRLSANVASSSGTPTVDINEEGASILSTKLTLDANEKTSITAAAAAVISDASLADDAEITFDIDVAGTGTKGLKVTLLGTRA